MLRKYERPGGERERERLLMKVFISASPGLITDAVRLGREGVAGEPDDLGLRDAVLGERENGRVLGREVELELGVDVESVCKEIVKMLLPQQSLYQIYIKTQRI